MIITNIHERVLTAQITEVGKLIDGLSSKDDKLWPHDRWPAMQFDRPLGIGAVGGHGPIRYIVESYQPGRSVRFRFTGPKGYIGTHRFEAEAMDGEKTRLRHIIEMRVQGIAPRLGWHMAIRPLHDALIEDALDRAQAYTGGQPLKRDWSPWVKFIRLAMKKRG